MASRINRAIELLEADQAIYYPSVIESLVTIGIIAAHVLFFVLLAKYFPIFEHHPETVDYSLPDHAYSTTTGHEPGQVQPNAAGSGADH